MSEELQNKLFYLTEAGHGIEGLLRVIEFLGFEKFKKIYNGEINKNEDNEINPDDILDTLNQLN